MKPSSLTQSDPRQRPLVDYYYQAATLEGAVACCVKRSKSLRAITRDYFDAETNRELLSEGAVFGTLIVAMAIVPIVSGLSAVLELCRALPLF